MTQTTCQFCAAAVDRKPRDIRAREHHFCNKWCFNEWKKLPQRRFWRYVVKTGGCWLWQGSVDRYGYGTILNDLMAHRYSYELHKGQIPSGLQVRHICDVRRCVNPGHLIVGTGQDNMNDMVKRGRSLTGERNHRAKLTAEAVSEIRASSLPVKELAVKFKVSWSLVYQVRSRKIWK